MKTKKLIPILTFVVFTRALGQDWVAYTSENFTLCSDASHEDERAQLAELQQAIDNHDTEFFDQLGL